MPTARSIHVRLDAAAADDLEAVRDGGLSSSEAVRVALAEAAARRRNRRTLADEARRLAADPEYRAEVEDTQAAMADIRAAW